MKGFVLEGGSVIPVFKTEFRANADGTVSEAFYPETASAERQILCIVAKSDLRYDIGEDPSVGTTAGSFLPEGTSRDVVLPKGQQLCVKDGILNITEYVGA